MICGPSGAKKMHLITFEQKKLLSNLTSTGHWGGGQLAFIMRMYLHHFTFYMLCFTAYKCSHFDSLWRLILFHRKGLKQSVKSVVENEFRMKGEVQKETIAQWLTSLNNDKCSNYELLLHEVMTVWLLFDIIYLMRRKHVHPHATYCSSTCVLNEYYYSMLV